MKCVDSARTAFLAAELESLGHRPQQAAHYAIALYLALIGLYEARRYNPGMADDGAFRALLELVLANLMSRKPSRIQCDPANGRGSG